MLDRSEGLISKIATGLSVAVGSQFFESLVRHLADALAADYAIVGELIPDNATRVKTLAVFGQGSSEPGFEYDLSGTPCESVLAGRTCVYAEAVGRHFPEDAVLARMGAEAYACTPLLGTRGKALGIMAVVYCQPLLDAAPVKSILEIFAARVAAELERKRNEESEHAARERYEQFIENSKDGFWRIECDEPVPLSQSPEEVLERFLSGSRIAEFNDAMAKMLGYQAGAELLGIRPLELAGIDQRREVLLRQIREGFPPGVVEFPAVDRNGRKHWLARTFVPIVKDECVHRVWGVTRDVTEKRMTEESLQESEERYRTLFEAAGEAIFVSREGFIDCNSRALDLYATTREEIIGKMPWDLAPEVQPDGMNSRVKAEQKIALAMSGQTITFEWQNRRPDGTLFDSEVTLSRMTLGGEPHRLSLVKDITERKKSERQIQEFNANLERLVAERTAQLAAANEELESFSYSISHDLRSAIRGISACSQIVMVECGDKLDASARQWLEYIHADTEQLDKLTLALLDLSRLSRAALHRTEVDLSAVSQGIAQRLAQNEPARHAEFKIAEGLTASGDPVLLQAVMDNLIGNAWKFSKQRDLAEIEVGCIDSETKGRVYFVRDNGIGFDMRYADKLFGAFQRLHRSNEFEGTGIGLATVRRIVHRHGGRVWAEGVVDRGATAFFTLGGVS